MVAQSIANSSIYPKWVPMITQQFPLAIFRV